MNDDATQTETDAATPTMTPGDVLSPARRAVVVGVASTVLLALGVWAFAPSGSTAASCEVPTQGQGLASLLAAKPAPGPLKRVRMAVEGMACVTCIGPIERKMTAEPGVYRVRVLPQEKAALVDYDPAQTDVVRLMQRFEAIGYPAQTWTEGTWLAPSPAAAEPST